MVAGQRAVTGVQSPSCQQLRLRYCTETTSIIDAGRQKLQWRPVWAKLSVIRVWRAAKRRTKWPAHSAGHWRRLITSLTSPVSSPHDPRDREPGISGGSPTSWDRGQYFHCSWNMKWQQLLRIPIISDSSTGFLKISGITLILVRDPCPWIFSLYSHSSLYTFKISEISKK